MSNKQSKAALKRGEATASALPVIIVLDGGLVVDAHWQTLEPVEYEVLDFDYLDGAPDEDIATRLWLDHGPTIRRLIKERYPFEHRKIMPVVRRWQRELRKGGK